MNPEQVGRKFTSSAIGLTNDDQKASVKPDKRSKKDKVKNNPSESKKRNTFVYLLFFVILLVAIAAAAYFYIQYSQLKPKVDDPSLALDAQIKQIKESLGKILLIDSQEDFSVILIKDADLYRKDNQEFYKNAQNGEFILVSPKRAIIYDAKNNMIVNVAPVLQTTPTPILPITAPSAVPTLKSKGF